MLAQISILAFAGLMLLAAWFDATKFTIPNWLSGAVALAFFPAMLLLMPGWGVFGFHMLAGLVALLLGMAVFAAGWAGGGDAKLFAAAALWFGWPDAAGFLMHTAVSGGALVLVLIALRRTLPVLGVPAGRIENTAVAQGAPVPYGIALAAGAMWSLPGSIWLV